MTVHDTRMAPTAKEQQKSLVIRHMAYLGRWDRVVRQSTTRLYQQGPRALRSDIALGYGYDSECQEEKADRGSGVH
ncbi:hypothetical protein DOTSEDRAFT_74060 [Dothistroma septosporum NZE10]|uniref:Uncharacterized protein n=1 Tax=Dothistroma septosporum (strain NZE10 / CBS 128990) TaxID=675120 RepID=N1PHM2_DOTSN|nr:hypothetical protein DOTSEDRAFT_74060 [Dothistroma septosporum NZE10]